jgi:hypothetical protein
LGDGLLLQSEPVVGSTPCLRSIYRYYQQLLDGTTKQNELSLGTYGKGGGRLTKAQALQKVREFQDWRKGLVSMLIIRIGCTRSVPNQQLQV